MEQSFIDVQFQWISHFLGVMSEEKAWRYREKESHPMAELEDGTIAIYREPYTTEEWRNVRKYLYRIGVKCGDKMFAPVLGKNGDHKWYKYDQEWHKLDIDDKIYMRAKKAKDKADAEEAAERQRQEEWRKAKEQERIEREKEEERRREEAIRREEERLASPMEITVGMWEEMQREIRDLRHELEHLSHFVDTHDPMEE